MAFASTLLLALVTIAFPGEGQRFPFLSKCYALGSTESLTTNLLVNGQSVSVSRTGAWATQIDVTVGTNTICAGDCQRTFIVASRSTEPSQPERVYSKLEYAADVPRSRSTNRKPSDLTIVLDAGHGGQDSGALSPHGLPEKDANLRLTRAVAAHLRAFGFKVLLTRETDIFIPLYDRPKLAHSSSADAFISIHHNAPGYANNPLTSRYFAVYAWNEIGEQLAQAISSHANAAKLGLENKGVLHANFAVTRNPEIPCCLIEADFVTHPEGEFAIWGDVAHREKLAKAIAEGISAWACPSIAIPPKRGL